jgi:hypothetical protein
MDRFGRGARALVAVAVLGVLLGVVALPTLAADPSASPELPGASAEAQPSLAAPESAQPAGSEEPDETAEPAVTAEPNRASEPEEQAKPDKDKGPKDHKDTAPEHEITLSGTVTTGTEEGGEAVYRIQSGGTTYVLEAGPKWFFGDDYPLKAYVGKNVTLVGEVAEGSTKVDVVSVDGTRLREPGKPPWAGGWKQVGEKHPGWSEEKAARWAEKQAGKQAKFGDCWPPGHCKGDEAGSEVAPTH